MGVTMTEETSVDTIECPFCAEVIKRKAAKCKHCGSDLSSNSQSAGVTNTTAKRPDGMVVYGPGAGSPDAAGIIFEGSGSQLQNIPVFALALIASMSSFASAMAAAVVLPSALIVVVYVYIKTMSTRYKVTDGRIEIDRGIFFKASDNVLLVKVKDVKLNRGLLGATLGIGTIRVISSDILEGELSLRAIPEAKQVYDKISAKLETIATRHGVVRY